MNKDTLLKVGVIGCGTIVDTVHLPVLLNINNIEISFLFDSDIEKSKKLARKFKLPYVGQKENIDWKEPDIFLIAIPYGARDNIYSEISSKAKKEASIFVEKPVVLSEEDIQKFRCMGLFSRTFAGFMRRHQSNTNILKEAVSNRNFVENIKEIDISEGSKVTSTSFESSNYRTSAKLSGGGVLAETSCHILDQLCYLFPGFDFKVSNSFIIYDGGIDVHVDATIKLTKGDINIPIKASFSRLKNIPSKINIIGNEISLKSGTKPEDKVLIEFNNSKGNFYTIDHKPGFSHKSYQSFYLEWMSVISDILDKKQSVNRLSNTYNSGILIESLYNFANKKKNIEKI